jgi:hypothetical protein
MPYRVRAHVRASITADPFSSGDFLPQLGGSGEAALRVQLRYCSAARFYQILVWRLSISTLFWMRGVMGMQWLGGKGGAHVMRGFLFSAVCYVTHLRGVIIAGSRVAAFREESTILFNSLHCVPLHSISFVHRYGLLSTYALLFHTISYKPGNGARTTGRGFAKRAKISRVCDPKCMHRMQEETCKGRDSVYVQLKVY